MNIVFFAHPTFLSSQSMPRFTRMLAEGMKRYGHNIEVWCPEPILHRFPAPASIKKWLGYIDQYILFPREVHTRLKQCAHDTLFVFTDHALGPWVPLVSDRPHVIHCHDFLAQMSALGKIKENPISWTGRLYQRYIRDGYSSGRHFIPVSYKTQSDLHKLLPNSPLTSEVVYNGLNGKFSPHKVSTARTILSAESGYNLSGGYLLHVGGNEWYKNRTGVIKLYNEWRKKSSVKLPLVMVGRAPSYQLQELQAQSPFAEDIHWVTDLTDEMVRLAYAGANVLLFPSLAEGFGWPIAEAMACGCPVITTDDAPMTEVAGTAGFYIPRMPATNECIEEWTKDASHVLEHVVLLRKHEREEVVKRGLENAARFNTEQSLRKIEYIYQHILDTEFNTAVKLGISKTEMQMQS
ncbi:glycosyltransferase [Pontibacter sp. H249]|uniref:glycosyltransferase n=1 Tax=Pontibacter sp. H249 TaxID=3133420 RepID=UPI0030C2CA80